jgi:predicted nuclease of restriction endonuclease-like (RecB) superfamily
MIKNIPVTKKSTSTVLPSGYAKFIAILKSKIRSSQLKATVSVNREMLLLYWEIGREIVERQERDGWGAKVIEKIAKDLQNEFPGIEGFSRTNIFRMRAFYLSYKLVPQAVGQLDQLPIFNLPWGHNVAIFEGVKDLKKQLWYAKMVIEESWSRSSLVEAINKDLYKSHGKAITNFHERLPEPNSSLAQATLHDPYHFDFLELGEEHKEKDLEEGLLSHVEKFMHELGQGFAFVGRQYHLQVSDKDFYLDLLFYHLKLRCFVIVELKTTEFKPEYVGKMNFYLSAVDDLMRHPDDSPSIGLLICKKKDTYIAEYALRDIKKPIGIAEYEAKIVSSLPKKFEGKLPTIQEIEAELEEHKKEMSSK